MPVIPCASQRARGDGPELVDRDDADAASFHLLEEAGGFDVAHEEYAFNGLDVSAGGNHVDGYRDTREEAVAEIGEDLFWREL